MIYIKNHTKKKSGFTLIELMVSISIIVLLSAVGMVSFRNATRSARNGRREADMEMVRSALVLYRTDNSQYPVGTDFDAMITDVSDYLSADTVSDPKDDATYFYSYSSDGATFTLGWSEEPDAVARSLANP